MTLQVIGAGFGRTGTLSLKFALEQLGYVKTHHMMEVLQSDAQADMWAAIGEGQPPDWDKVFEGYQASVDFPSCIFYRELADKYPNAKVILTVRSAESWWQSASQTIFAIGKAAPPWLKLLVPRMKKVFGMHEKLIAGRTFRGKQDNAAFAKSTFEHHNLTVQRVIPKERLLVFEVKQGWGPLCAFLGKPVPETPFPNVNDTAEFKKRIMMMHVMTWGPWVLLALIAAGLLLNTILTSGPHGT